MLAVLGVRFSLDENGVEEGGDGMAFSIPQKKLLLQR
jgi:hypothetical protein